MFVLFLCFSSDNWSNGHGWPNDPSNEWMNDASSCSKFKLNKGFARAAYVSSAADLYRRLGVTLGALLQASRRRVPAAIAKFCVRTPMINAFSSEIAVFGSCSNLRICQTRCLGPSRPRHNNILKPSDSYSPSRALNTARSCYTLCARNPRYDDEYVEVDDEDRWTNQARRNVGLVPSLAKPVLLAANGLAERLTNVACEIVPDTIERGTVDVAVKAGLVLAAVSIARSLLGVALTVGTVLFGIYVATKIWTKQDTTDPPGNTGRTQPKRRRRSSVQDDNGLSDVWFEKGSKRKTTPKKPEEPFWFQYWSNALQEKNISY
ncbi:hypothetical protein ABBQ32_009978 [Trebouxia sp. C0010 RCD-2024]